MKRIQNPSDFYAGIGIVAIALFTLYASADLAGTTGFSLGPGSAPRLFAGLLLALGLIIAATAVVTKGPELPRFACRGPLLVTCSILIFALSIRPMGLVLTSFFTFVFAASGSKETRWIEAILAAVALTVFCTLLFVFVLDLPFRLWPRFALGSLRIGA